MPARGMNNIQIEDILMSKSIINANKIQKTLETPKALPVYVADLTIEPSKIKVEFEHLPGPCLVEEFINSEEGIQKMLLFFYKHNIKGSRLFGKKKECNLIAEQLVKQNIRILIGEIEKPKKKSSALKKLEGMPIINESVAGIDIGKSIIFVAVPPHLTDDHTRAFGTNTEDLKEIANWLLQLKITSIAMESTSVYWTPLFDLCEERRIKPLIVNPKHVKMLPGRKTDVLDAQWLLKLLACGLLQGGFIPPLEIRALRDLTRYRQNLMEGAADHLNRMHKALSLMNIQLSNVMSDISGASGQRIIESILQGKRNPEALASLAEKNCKSTPEEIAKALDGMYREEHLFVLRQEYKLYNYTHGIIIETEQKIEEMLRKLPDAPNVSSPPEYTKKKPKRKKTTYNRSPYSFDLRNLLYKKFSFDLTAIPGIEESSAATIIFETGGNVDAFPTSRHFASWAGLSPGNKISGGKVLSGKAPKKFSRVGQACRVAANANYKSDTALGANLRRHLRKGKSKKTSRKATAHKICTSLYNMMKFGQEYVEIGAAAYEARYEERKIASCKKTLQSYGYDCSSIVKK